jgi:peptide/nickel transport system ATP-binding protein
VTAEPILEIENLSTDIVLPDSVVHALSDVSLTIGRGETVGLVGESGCGKSMLGLSIMRLLPHGGRVVSGSIRVDGRDLVELSDPEMRDVTGNDVAMIFQDSLTSLNPTMTIGNQIAEPLRRHRSLSKASAREQAIELLGMVGLPHPRDRIGDFPHQFSGGQRQRIMIAMALSCDPKVLLADEPTTALDVTIQAEILDLLDGMSERVGMGTLLVTHDMGVVAGRADRVVVMYAGQIVESAPTVEMFANMRHPYTQALLASIPLLTQSRDERLFSIPGLPPDLKEPPPGCRFAPRCRYATEQCWTEAPVLSGSDGHLFACWNPVSGALDRSAPAQSPLDVLRPTAAAEPPGKTATVMTPAATDGAELAGSLPESGPGSSGVLLARTAEQVLAAEQESVLVADQIVREYPVKAGVLLRRTVDSVKAVSGVSFEVSAGQTFGLVGESGCGKTTLGKVIVALEQANSGRATIDGVDMTQLNGRGLRTFRRHVQMMFQDPATSLDPRMKVGAILREPLRAQGIGTRREQDEVVSNLLGEVGLPAEAVERFPHEFSGGQRQRLGLARALTLNPHVIVADEPVSALDVSIRSQVLNLMKRLQAQHNLTYVVISHDLAVVKYLADRIGVMYLGKIVEIGTGEDIYRHSAHHYTAGLIAAIPEPDPTIVKTDRPSIAGELPDPRRPPSGCRFRTRCPAAQTICGQEEPPLREVGDGHAVACHFPL